MDELEILITDPSVKVVSFDIFDTLLVRPAIEPTDVFYLIEKNVQENLGLDDFQFSYIRKWAEKEARRRAGKYEEITLDEIYLVLKELSGLDERQSEAVKSIEVEIENKYLCSRKNAKKYYDLALAHGKRVIVISDMYMPKKAIVGFLVKNGFDAIERHYVSSEIRLTKASGNLFKYVLNDLGIPAEEMLHIGDHPRVDVSVPLELGIKAYHRQKLTWDFFRNKIVDASLWDGKLTAAEPSFRLMFGFILNEIFDAPPPDGTQSWNKESVFNADPYVLGFYGAGPLVFFFVRWLLEQTCGEYDTLAFIARDGKIPFEIYSVLAPLYVNSPLARYVRISRDICTPCGLLTQADVAAILQKTPASIFKRSAREFLVRCLCLTINPEIEQKLAARGIALDEPVDNPEFLMQCVLELGETMLNGARLRQDQARRYYRDVFDKAGRIAICDVGYSGRVQKILSGLLNTKTTGFYIAVYHDMLEFGRKGQKYYSYLSPPYNRWIHQDQGGNLGGFRFSPAILEMMTAEHDKGSVRGFDEVDGIVSAVLEQPQHAPEAACIAMQRGILDFTKKMVTMFGKDICVLDVTPMAAAHALFSFMTNPLPADAEIIRNISYNEGGNKRRFDISPKAEINNGPSISWTFPEFS